MIAASTASNAIVLADSYEDCALPLSLLLRSGGYEVQCADCGTKAMALARSVPIHAAIIDSDLPDVSAYDLARSLRSLPTPRPILLILTSSWAPEDLRTRALAAGFDHLLMKPLDFDLLIRTLRSQGA